MSWKIKDGTSGEEIARKEDKNEVQSKEKVSTEEESEETEDVDQADSEAEVQVLDEDDSDDVSTDEEDDESTDSDEEEEDSDEEESEEEVDSETEEEIDQEEDPDEEYEEVDVADMTEGLFETEDELREYSKLLKDNPELKEMIDYFKAEGTVLPYLQATQVDYDQVSTVELLKHEYAQEIGLDPSDEDFEFMFNEDVLKKYKLDNDEDYDERDVRLGKKRAEIAANKIRKSLKDEQSKFKVPVREEQSQQNDEDQEALRKANQEQFQSHLKKTVKNNKLKVQAGDSEYELSVSPKELSEFAGNSDLSQVLLDQDGNLDLVKLSFLKDPDKFISSIASNAGVDKTKEFIDKELKNKKKPKGKSNKEKPKQSWKFIKKPSW